MSLQQTPGLHGQDLCHSDGACGQYCCIIPSLQLADEARLAGVGTLTPEVQRRLAEEVFGDGAFGAAPPAPAYRRRLLQALVRAAEEDGCELSDELVELFTAAQLVRRCWRIL